MTSSNLVQLGITDIADVIRTRQLSPVELVQSYLGSNPDQHIFLSPPMDKKMC